MADLAGFDVIGEIHMETIVDLVNNLLPLTNPVDGKSIYVFGGPFSTDLTVDLGLLGVITVRVILEATLQAVVHQPLAQVVISLEGGSTAVPGRSLSHIGGQATVSVPLGFTLPPTAPALPGIPSGLQVPVFLFGAVNPILVLDGATRSLADATLGQGGADRLTSALQVALAKLLALAGTKPVPAVGFTVMPGVDSNNPLQLSASPTVAWIDAATLGVFGHYRAAANGGDVTVKTTSDLHQVHEEFFYNQPGVTSVLPGRRVALLLSADAFEMVVACPTIRNSLVRGLVEKREHGKWVACIRNQDGAAIFNEETQANLVKHLMEEIHKSPHDSLQSQFERAKADVQADVDAIIEKDATAEEKAWLDSSAPDPRGCETSGGQQEITDAVPPPCGKGSVNVYDQPVDNPTAQSNLVVMLDRLDVRLGEGRITVHFEADASLEDSLGDLSAIPTGDMDIFITVTYLGQVNANFRLHDISINPGATGLIGGLLALVKSIFSLGGTWGAVMAYLNLVVQATLQDDYIAPRSPYVVPVLMPQKLFPTRMVDVKIDPQSLLVLGLVCRRPRWNEFSPGLLVDATIDKRVPADQPAIHGKLKFPSTEWGCQAAEFDTTRNFWNTTVSVRARLRDAPLPVTVLGWQIEIGNFTVNTIANAHMLDPRPSWSNEPATIVAGHLALAGSVNHPDPPVVLISLPYALGHLQRREDVSVDVTGDPDKGWQLRFSGVDGNFYVRFSLDVRDGDDVQWHSETFVTLIGDQFDLPPEYTQYKADCDAKYSRFMRLKLAGMGLVAIGQVEPGQPVMSGETREAVAIQTLVATGNPGALRHLVAASERFGPKVLGLVGHVSPLSLTLQQLEGQRAASS